MWRIGLGVFVAVILASTAQSQSQAQKSKAAGAGGPSCTHERCMDSCQRLGGKYCAAYCEKTLKERRMTGVCK